MRDLTDAAPSLRSATARGWLEVSRTTVAKLRLEDPIFAVARAAGTTAAKRTSELLPDRAPVWVEYVDLQFELREEGIGIRARVKGVARTAVEAEALSAVSVAALSLMESLGPLGGTVALRDVRAVRTGEDPIPFRRPTELRAAVLVVSDRVSRGEYEDSSGARIVARLKAEGVSVTRQETVPDEVEAIASFFLAADEDLLVSTGGTGVGPRDVTPEAVRPWLDRELPGVVAAILAYGQARNPRAMLSRVVAGVRGNSVVLCLPGSPGGVEDGMNAVFPALLHAVEMVRGEGHP